MSIRGHPVRAGLRAGGNVAHHADVGARGIVAYTVRNIGRIYLDHNATCPIHPSVAEAMAAAFHVGGNPSSLHHEGRRARDLVEDARRAVASLCGVAAMDVVFTSGGTESNALGILGLASALQRAGRPQRVATTRVEHPSLVLAARRLAQLGWDLCELPVDRHAVLDMDALGSWCAGGGGLLAVSLANHEVGTVQDLALIADMARARGVVIHCDAVQGAGRLDLTALVEHVDSIAMSAHKFSGPRGVGALWVRPGLELDALAPGHQERGRRGGTENVGGIVGMGHAASIAATDREAKATHTQQLRDQLQAGLAALPGVAVYSMAPSRLCNTVNVGFDGALGDVVVAALDLAGIAASPGAACTSGRVEPSQVLLAMGYTATQASSAVRFSLGASNTPTEIKVVLEELPTILSRVRAVS